MIRYDTRDWLRLLGQVRGTVVPRVLPRTLMVATLAALAVIANDEGWADVTLPATAHAMVGVALGLLLVFRTNASYARYWEGRLMLGGVVNNARDLARQARSYLDSQAQKEIGVLVVAYARILKRRLRDETDYAEVDRLVGPSRRAELEATDTPTLLCARWISDALAESASRDVLSEDRLRMMDSTVSDLIDRWGGCERILRTPVPFAYAHHIKLFLTLFCFTAPLALLPMGWFALPASAVVAFGLFGIDEIGVEIEDPFGYDANDLPLDPLTDMVESNVFEVLHLPPTSSPAT